MLQDYHFSTSVRVRLPETDAHGIAFHGWFFTYMDAGRMDYLRNLGLVDASRPARWFRNVIVRAACEFKSPARFDDELVVHVRTAEIGRTSFRFEFAMTHRRENRLVASGETVHVAMDEGEWKPVPVPEEFRRAVREFEGRSLKERKA